MEKIYDVVVIGAGPVGIFTSHLSSYNSLDTLIIDSHDELGGQLLKYPEKNIYDLPGYDKITAREFVDRLIAQLKTSGSQISLNTYVSQVQQDSESKIFTLTTNKGDIHTKAVILATGNGSSLPRKLGLVQEDEVTNISYFVEQKSKYQDKDVVIFGGGDSAVDWANELSEIAKTVTIIHRRNEFRAPGTSVDKLTDAKNVNVLTPYNFDEGTLKNDTLHSVEITNNEDDSKLTINGDEFLIFYGSIVKNDLINNIDNLDVLRRKIVTCHENQTTMPGIFSVGDASTKDANKVYSILPGLGEVHQLILSVRKYLFPDQKIRNVFSSMMKGEK